MSEAAFPQSSEPVAVTSNDSRINLALNRPYTVVATWPDPLFEQNEKAYPDPDNTKLTDGKTGSTAYSHPAWRAFNRQSARRIQVDLGAEATIHELMGRFLQSKSVGVYVPRYVRFSLSVDGQTWYPVGQVETQVGAWNPAVKVEEFRLTGLQHVARYVQLEFPVDVNVMMDELQALGTPGKQADSISLSTLTPPLLSAPGGHSDAALQGTDYPRRGMMRGGDSAVAGSHHMVLLTYAYPPNASLGEWQVEDYLPYVAYLSAEGEIEDWLFDSVILSPQGTTPSGRQFSAVTPDKSAGLDDWQWLVEQTFRPGYQLDALERAVGQAKEAMQQPDYKLKVYLTLVRASSSMTAFGDLGTGMLNLDHTQVGREKALANRLAAEAWLLDQYMQNWEERGYQNLELVGIWWHPEAIGFSASPDDDELVRQVANLVHERGLKFIWIPFYGSEGSYDWFNYGFDAAILQPNYMFSNTMEERLRIAANMADTLGMGIEIEKHWNSGTVEVTKWLDYLNGGVTYGYMNSVNGYYQGFKDFGNASQSDRFSRMLYYEYLYQYVNGEYEVHHF